MKFQLERIALFSDAVFAIAITLMMIEIKPPHLPHEATFTEVSNSLLAMLPTFVGTIMSFFFIGLFWRRHHQLMKYMIAYNPKVIMLNLTFLLTIAFIPFSTSLVFENMESSSPLPLIIYNLNYILASLTCYRLFTYILNPTNGLRVATLDEDQDMIKKELLFPVFVYSLVAGLSLVSNIIAPVAYAAFSLEPLFVKRKRQVAQPVAVPEKG